MRQPCILSFLYGSPLFGELEKLHDNITESSQRSVELIIPHCLRQEQEMN